MVQVCYRRMHAQVAKVSDNGSYRLFGLGRKLSLEQLNPSHGSENSSQVGAALRRLNTVMAAKSWKWKVRDLFPPERTTVVDCIHTGGGR